MRADVEWLLATPENGRGPVDWNDESQRERKGLNLRGAILSGVNLSGLPLACMLGGLTAKELFATISESSATDQRDMAAVHLEEAILTDTHLEGANLSKGHLERANARRAYLEEAILSKARLEGAILRLAHLEGAVLYMTHLEEVNLQKAFFNNVTNLEGVILGNQLREFASLSDVSWNGVNLAVVDWTNVKILGEEFKARHKMRDKNIKQRTKGLEEYEQAVRANRQLAVALQSQGLNEVAAHFAYRAQKLQRVVLRRQKKFGQYLFSHFLDLLAGYGYRPGRSVIWYLVTIFGFALAYFAIGQLPCFPDSFVFSLTSLSPRLPSGFSEDDARIRIL